MRRKDTIIISLQALLCLFNKNCFIDNLIEQDYQKEMTSNTQLACSEEQVKVKFRLSLKESTLSRMLLLRKKLIYSFLWVVGGLFAGLIFTNGVSIVKICVLKLPNILGIISIIFFSIGTLARLGWEGQSWKGDTVFEQLDSRLFWLFYFLGVAFGTSSFLSS